MHKTRVHHPVTLSCDRANQSWLYSLNAERLARKQSVPIITPLVWRGRGSNPRHPDYEANTLSIRPPREEARERERERERERGIETETEVGKGLIN